MALIKCPKCGHQVSDLATECPNCGLAIKDALHQYLCPDCGKLITDNSAQCPNCGCPPEHFIVKPAEAYTTDKPNYNPSNLPSNNKTKTSPSQKEGSNYGVIILCIVALFAAVIFIPIYSHLQKERVETEQIEYEHQQRAGQEAREREEENAKREYENSRKSMLNDIVGTWTSENIPSNNTYSGYYYFVITFNRSMTFDLYMYELMTNRSMDHSSGKYEVIPAGKSDNYLGYIIINPKIDNKSVKVYNKRSLEINGYSFHR